jgi:quercetin dioxygenase-like cupin family protein
MPDVIEQNFFATDKPLTERVQSLKSELLKMEQIELPTEHLFHGGMYCRQVWRPAGCTIVGKVHKKEHFYMVVVGTVIVTTEEGAQELTAPSMICSKPGTQRAVFAVTDAMCMTIHRADATTVEGAADELVEDDPDSAFDALNNLKDKLIEVAT